MFLLLRAPSTRCLCTCSLLAGQSRSFSTTIAPTFVIQKRWKVKEKWSAYRRPDQNSDRALKYFDSYYSSVFGSDKWASMRLALMCRKSYCAMVNRFSEDASSTVIDLIEEGSNLMPPEPATAKSFYELPDEMSLAQKETNNEEIDDEFASEIKSELASDQQSEMTSFDPPPKNQGLDSFMPSPPVVTPSDEKRRSEERLFVGSTEEQSDAELLHEGFSVQTIPWSSSIDDMFPSSLQVFCYPTTEVKLFPEPKPGNDGLYTYYLMDLASIFTVLALDPKPGERILDLCAAPGGKSLAILQCCTPRQLVCVDKSPSRSKRLQNTLSAYVPSEIIDDVVEVFPGCDAISFADNHCASFRRLSDAAPGFDKVLVDAPCLNDRISVTEDENNWFKPSRSKERLALPEEQRDILIAALRCCAVGGVVVYSTCTLAPGQNDGVIFAALEMAAKNFNIKAVVEDPQPFRKFITDRHLLNIEPSWSRFGYLVAPILTANFGPSFCCRLRRTA